MVVLKNNTALKAIMIGYCLVATLSLHGSLRQKMIDAIEDEDFYGVQRLLDESANVNDQDCNGWCPLMLAVSCNHLELSGFLLKAKADINMHNKDGLTALHIAAKEGYGCIVNHLLKNKADHAILDCSGSSALMHAVDDTISLRCLINAQSDINLKDKIGKTALLRAKEIKKYGVIGILLASNADYNVTDISEEIENILLVSDLFHSHGVYKRIIYPLLHEHAKLPKEVLALIAGFFVWSGS